MKLRRKSSAFTLVELLIVISIIAILAGFAIPGAMGVLNKAQRMSDVANVKNIITGLFSFAVDHDGAFPSQSNQDGDSPQNLTGGSTANDAYANLIPRYLPFEKTFWMANSKWCNAAKPDENVSDGQRLKGGENNYAYVCGLSMSSNASFPVIADGFSNNVGVYSTNQNEVGGIWKGEYAVVGRVDGSAAAEVILGTSGQKAVTDYIGGNSNTKQNIFSTGVQNWLTTTNYILNPTQPSN